MTDFWSVQNGFVIMIVCILSGVLLVFSGGYIIDNLLDITEDIGMYDDIPSDSPWLNFTLRDGMINLYYLISGVGIPVYGIGTFYLTITRRHRWDLEQNLYNTEEY